jgi:hypothetical protein
MVSMDTDVDACHLSIAEGYSNTMHTFAWLCKTWLSPRILPFHGTCVCVNIIQLLCMVSD